MTTRGWPGIVVSARPTPSERRHPMNCYIIHDVAVDDMPEYRAIQFAATAADAEEAYIERHYRHGGYERTAIQAHEGIAFVNAYELTQGYGGPEEGGWWYDCGTPLASIPVTTEAERDAAVAKLKALFGEEYDQRREYTS